MALAAFERRAKLPGDGPSSEGRYYFGLVLARLGRHEEAAAAFREVLGRDPDNRGALQNLARSDIPLGLKEERTRSLERFQELYAREVEQKTRRVHVRDLLAEARRRAEANDPSAAVATLKEAALLSPEDEEVRIELGRYLARAGDRSGSEKVLRLAIEKEPLDAEAHYQLGRVLADAGEVAPALDSFERAAQIEPMSLKYRTSLAQIYLRMHRNEEGVRELRLARSLDPADPEAAFNLGLGLAQAGSLREAADELESAAKLGYRQPVIHQVLAQIYAGLGDARRAAEEKAAFESQGESERPRP
jgi:Flp pilus assembly protein TadD